MDMQEMNTKIQNENARLTIQKIVAPEHLTLMAIYNAQQHLHRVERALNGA